MQKKIREVFSINKSTLTLTLLSVLKICLFWTALDNNKIVKKIVIIFESPKAPVTMAILLINFFDQATLSRKFLESRIQYRRHISRSSLLPNMPIKKVDQLINFPIAHAQRHAQVV